MITQRKRSKAPSRILVVASDLPFRDASIAHLKAAGYRSDGADDTDGAWDALHRYGYKLLVIDQKIPRGSALRFLLKISHANLSLPVVLVTEAPWPFDPRTHCRLRSVTVLPRPFTVEHLLEIILANSPNETPSGSLPQRFLPWDEVAGAWHHQNLLTESSSLPSDDFVLLSVQDPRGAELKKDNRKHASHRRGVIHRVLHREADPAKVLPERCVAFGGRSITAENHNESELGSMIGLARRRALPRLRDLIARRGSMAKMKLAVASSTGRVLPDQNGVAPSTAQGRPTVTTGYCSVRTLLTRLRAALRNVARLLIRLEDHEVDHILLLSSSTKRAKQA